MIVVKVADWYDGVVVVEGACDDPFVVLDKDHYTEVVAVMTMVVVVAVNVDIVVVETEV